MKLRLGLLAAFLLFAAPARPQGCAQCRDNVQGAPLPVQQAYRHAIELLAASGIAVFAGGIVLLCRYRQRLS